MGDKDPRQVIPDEVMAQYRAESSEAPAAAVDLRTAGMQIVELPDQIPGVEVATPKLDPLPSHYNKATMLLMSEALGLRRD